MGGHSHVSGAFGPFPASLGDVSPGGHGCRKGWGWAWELVEAVELGALGFSAQPGYFQGLLRICADLPQLLGACTPNLGSASGQCASEKTGPHPQALLASCR